LQNEINRQARRERQAKQLSVALLGELGGRPKIKIIDGPRFAGLFKHRKPSRQ
jgi:hypothetical protein